MTRGRHDEIAGRFDPVEVLQKRRILDACRIVRSVGIAVRREHHVVLPELAAEIEPVSAVYTEPGMGKV